MGHGASSTLLVVTGVLDQGSGIIGQQFANDVLDQAPFKPVMASRNRRVGCEQCSLRQFLAGPSLSKHFQHGEGAVPLIEVHAGKGVPEGLEGLYAAYPQEVFLSDAGVIISTVEPCTQADEFSRIVWVERVEEVDRDDMARYTDHIGSPHAGVER